ncbi:Rab GDP-dissociation inhibitor [Astathelohania contejeani]|uniref:Rab GDP-dissociation inhibitor n=1 Tax=Astathelohania contejeani TaxID=164912 RepID=A0ABQ7HX72_9MICR|nr:Rab GDP-dissociation inhibitor [Thelohania contejeani]
MDSFKIIYEGTTIKDSIEVRKYIPESIIVIDKQENYGSSYTDIASLAASKYVHGLKIFKEPPSNTQLTIEAMPQLLRMNDPCVTVIKKLGIAPFLKFAKIEHVFYFKDKVYPIPHNRGEIAISEFLSNRDKFYLNRDLNGEYLRLTHYINQENVGILLKGITGRHDAHLPTLERFINNFGNTPFLYPVYGMKEITEMIARCNAISGVNYLISSDLEKSNNVIKSKLGVVKGEKYISGLFKKGKCRYIRVVNTKQFLFFKSYYAVFDGPELINCICLDSTAKTCAPGTYLLYFWKYESEICIEELMKIGLKKESIIADFSYRNEIEYEWDVVG